MESIPHHSLTRLAAPVLEYASPPFALKSDLERLLAVHRAGAPEAVIVYGARILEALAADALRRVGQAPSPNAFSNLEVLEQLNRLGRAVRYWAHALRRLGNAVRHLGHETGPEEAELSVLFLEGWLDWFFCRFSHGLGIPSVTQDQRPLGLVPGEEVRALMIILEEIEASTLSTEPVALRVNVEASPALLRTPALAAVLAEILLSRKLFADALRVLEAGLARFPDDLRLRQLMGLHWSRAHHLEKALAWLKPLSAEFPDDEETAGITAGVYKRRWEADRACVADLEQSQRIYRKAWKNSGKKNTYLGINSAATALFLQRHEEARRLAAEVEELLRRRTAGLPPDLRDPQLTFQFWDQVTLAEAHLIQGHWETARQLYRAAFVQHSARQSDIEVSRKQRSEVLKALGVADTFE